MPRGQFEVQDSPAQHRRGVRGVRAVTEQRTHREYVPCATIDRLNFLLHGWLDATVLGGDVRSWHDVHGPIVSPHGIEMQAQRQHLGH